MDEFKEARERWVSKYLVYNILTKTKDYELHDWMLWNKCVLLLNTIIDPLEYKGDIQTAQKDSEDGKFLTFGKMDWNEEGNRQWTSKYKTGENKIESLCFRSATFCFPPFREVSKKGIKSHIYIELRKNIIQNDKRFDFAFFLAFSEDVIERIGEHVIEKIVREIGTLINAILIVKKYRQWSYLVDGSYTDRIMDYSPILLLDNSDEYRFRDDEKDWEVIYSKVEIKK
jgi:hypothetical protein